MRRDGLRLREGKLRALAITSIKHSARAPDLPTMAESGFPGFEAVPWFGLLAPTGTPKDVLDKLHGVTVKALAMPDLRRRALAEIRQQPGCHNVQDIAINRVTDQNAKIIGRYVCCPRALRMPTPRLAPHSKSNLFCDSPPACNLNI
jgi:Tripartite tricarboxylate transporter family receptor